MASEKQVRPTISPQTVEKLKEFLKNTEHGKKIELSTIEKTIGFILLDYIKEHS